MIARLRATGLAPGLGAWLVAGLLVAACGSGGPATPATPPAASPGTPPTATVTVTVASPVSGVVVRLESTGLTEVTGFRLRTDDGTELEFTMGVTENGVAFPPAHLAEHMASLSRVRVHFREAAGTRVVHRLEDADD